MMLEDQQGNFKERSGHLSNIYMAGAGHLRLSMSGWDRTPAPSCAPRRRQHKENPVIVRGRSWIVPTRWNFETHPMHERESTKNLLQPRWCKSNHIQGLRPIALHETSPQDVTLAISVLNMCERIFQDN